MSWIPKAVGALVVVSAAGAALKLHEMRDDWKDAPQDAVGEDLGRLWTGTPGTEADPAEVSGAPVKIGRQLDPVGYSSFSDAVRAAQALGDEPHAIVSPQKPGGEGWFAPSGRYYVFGVAGDVERAAKLADTGDSKAYLVGGDASGLAANDFSLTLQAGANTYALDPFGPAEVAVNANHFPTYAEE